VPRPFLDDSSATGPELVWAAAGTRCLIDLETDGDAGTTRAGTTYNGFPNMLRLQLVQPSDSDDRRGDFDCTE